MKSCYGFKVRGNTKFYQEWKKFIPVWKYVRMNGMKGRNLLVLPVVENAAIILNQIYLNLKLYILPPGFYKISRRKRILLQAARLLILRKEHAFCLIMIIHITVRVITEGRLSAGFLEEAA